MSLEIHHQNNPGWISSFRQKDGSTIVNGNFQRLPVHHNQKAAFPDTNTALWTYHSQAYLKMATSHEGTSFLFIEGVGVFHTRIKQIFPAVLSAILCSVLIWIWLDITNKQSLNWKVSLTPTHEIQLSSIFKVVLMVNSFHQRIYFIFEQVDISISLENHFSHRCSASIEGFREREKLVKWIKIFEYWWNWELCHGMITHWSHLHTELKRVDTQTCSYHPDNFKKFHSQL